jgi:hypothetical protein
MEPERWQKIERLCYSALNEEKSARAAFLERACNGDEALHRAVELLLAQNEIEDNFLDTPAMEVAARRLARQADATSLDPRKCDNNQLERDKFSRSDASKIVSLIDTVRYRNWLGRLVLCI